MTSSEQISKALKIMRDEIDIEEDSVSPKFDTLITCLEKAVEALSLLDNQDRSKGYPTGKEWMLLLEKQDDALTQISELLQGKR